eukprot:4584832-Prymnesium_polylepis.1
MAARRGEMRQRVLPCASGAVRRGGGGAVAGPGAWRRRGPVHRGPELCARARARARAKGDAVGSPRLTCAVRSCSCASSVAHFWSSAVALARPSAARFSRPASAAISSRSAPTCDVPRACAVL